MSDEDTARYKEVAEELMTRFKFSRYDLVDIGNKKFAYEIPFYAETLNVTPTDIKMAVSYVKHGGKTRVNSYNMRIEKRKGVECNV